MLFDCFTYFIDRMLLILNDELVARTAYLTGRTQLFVKSKNIVCTLPGIAIKLLSGFTSISIFCFPRISSLFPANLVESS